MDGVEHLEGPIEVVSLDFDCNRYRPFSSASLRCSQRNMSMFLPMKSAHDLCVKQLAASLASWRSPVTLEAIQPSLFIIPGTRDSLASSLVLLPSRSFGRCSYFSIIFSIILCS